MKTGSDNVLKITTSYLIDDDSDDADIIVRESSTGFASITNLNLRMIQWLMKTLQYLVHLKRGNHSR